MKQQKSSTFVELLFQMEDFMKSIIQLFMVFLLLTTIVACEQEVGSDLSSGGSSSSNGDSTLTLSGSGD